MSTINDTAVWAPAVTEIGVTDPIQGGETGVINVQAKQLADRTAYLKLTGEATAGVALAADGKAAQALAAIAAAEAAAGGSLTNAEAALLHKNAALAARALAEDARDAAQGAQTQAGQAANYTYQAQQTAQAKASEATTAATTAVTAASAAAAARDQFIGSSATAAAAITSLAAAKVADIEDAGATSLAPVVEARNATLSAAASAAAQAGTAVGAAVTSSAERAAAVVARAAAETAASVAGAARDAATVNADVYVDVATGLAAVADGVQFQVVAADGLSIQRYRRDAGPVAVAVGVPYPSAAKVDVLAEQLDGYYDWGTSGALTTAGKTVNPNRQWVFSAVFASETVVLGVTIAAAVPGVIEASAFSKSGDIFTKGNRVIGNFESGQPTIWFDEPLVIPAGGLFGWWATAGAMYHITSPQNPIFDGYYDNGGNAGIADSFTDSVKALPFSFQIRLHISIGS